MNGVKREITGAAPLPAVNGMARELALPTKLGLDITVVTVRSVSEAAESSKAS